MTKKKIINESTKLLLNENKKLIRKYMGLKLKFEKKIKLAGKHSKDLPKRAVQPVSFYLKEKFQETRKNTSLSKTSEIFKKIHQDFLNLSQEEKEIYFKKYQIDKERFRVEKDEYNLKESKRKSEFLINEFGFYLKSCKNLPFDKNMNYFTYHHQRYLNFSKEERKQLKLNYLKYKLDFMNKKMKVKN
jgi:hypothetical protein